MDTVSRSVAFASNMRSKATILQRLLKLKLGYRKYAILALWPQACIHSKAFVEIRSNHWLWQYGISGHCRLLRR